MREPTRQVQVVSVKALDESSGGASELFADHRAPDPMATVQARETLRGAGSGALLYVAAWILVLEGRRLIGRR